MKHRAPETAADPAWVALMSAALADDERAYRRLLDAAAKLAARVARRSLRGQRLASVEIEDIVQETLIAVHLGRHRWRAEVGLAPWIASIARNKAIDAMRRAARRPTLPLDDEGAGLPAVFDDWASVRLDLLRLISGLRPRQRMLVIGVMLHGFSIGEIAKRLQMSGIAGRVMLHRAMRALKQAAETPRRPGAGKRRAPNHRSDICLTT